MFYCVLNVFLLFLENNCNQIKWEYKVIWELLLYEQSRVQPGPAKGCTSGPSRFSRHAIVENS